MAKTIVLSNKWYGQGQHWLTHSSSTTQNFIHRKKVDIVVNSSDSNAKRANLFAAKKERVKLPKYDDDDDDLGGKKYHISEFLSHPSGIAAVLNTSALQSFQSLDANTYRCALPKLRFLNFEAAPLLDLRVTSTNEDCLVEMISCKFEGSEIVEQQNNHFSAFMVNHMTWGGADAESFLEADVKLNLTLEIYTSPFTMMPISAVERPGNLMMQALVDKLVPLLLQQMLQDYDDWVQKQLDSLNQEF
ncbi:uncharacterized protein LOC133307793 isoform X2 [Gastrolobium bilobum]|uniref:uncharacterized protein LOC133307793 isoform X2 n=1 Tax=Gastrolobium bilobum TaxID=150636 RepID=UPI002AAFEA69|nr:uncharacterized protein LOC133307793 isoform X2 [Gastrolobium bilobum]